jgi:hypothetical protein
MRLIISLLILAFPALGPAEFPITTHNTSRPIGSNRWEWTVFIRTDPSTLAKIRCVEYLLHPTFPDRDRTVCDPGDNAGQAFPLTATGWGVFDIPITVIFTDGHTESLIHHLRFDTAAAAVKSRTVEVLGQEGWKDTGIQVNKGDRLSLTATGGVEWETGSRVGPEGSSSKLKPYPWRPAYPVADIGAGGLIAKIGSGAPFRVGKTVTVTTSDTGELFLGINDNNFEDNKGGFVVDVTLNPSE